MGRPTANGGIQQFGQRARCQERDPSQRFNRGAVHDGTRWGTNIQDLYTDPKDAALHQRAIERLARRLDRPIGPVKIAYELEYARLKIDAKVTKFLGVFASRRARDALLLEPT